MQFGLHRDIMRDLQHKNTCKKKITENLERGSSENLSNRIVWLYFLFQITSLANLLCLATELRNTLYATAVTGQF
jgi:hypothetical protein